MSSVISGTFDSTLIMQMHAFFFRKGSEQFIRCKTSAKMSRAMASEHTLAAAVNAKPAT